MQWPEPMRTPRKPPTATLLVVEDDEVARDGLREFLSEEGFIVHVAANGVDALVVVERHRPALVITDLEMPQMDGRALIAELRGREATPAIVVVTAQRSTDAKREANRLGVDGYVNKPIDLDALLRCIRGLV
jgi:DNA-binding response OmpR family regulator